MSLLFPQIGKLRKITFKTINRKGTVNSYSNRMEKIDRKEREKRRKSRKEEKAGEYLLNKMKLRIGLELKLRIETSKVTRCD